MIAFAAAAALLMFLPALSSTAATLGLSRTGVALGVGTVVIAGWLAATTEPEPGLLVAYGRWMVT